MKKGGIFVLLVLISVANVKQLQAEEISLGVAILSPTGLTAKFWVNDKSAVDVFGNWSFSGGKFNIHADYLVHNFNLIKIDENPFPFYYGVGARVKDENKDDVIMGVRIPFGVSYLYSTVPLDVFGEIAPRLNITPDTNFGLDIMVGVRYRFMPNNNNRRTQRMGNNDSRNVSTKTEY